MPSTLLGEKNLSFFDASAPIVAKSFDRFHQSLFQIPLRAKRQFLHQLPFHRDEYEKFVMRTPRGEEGVGPRIRHPLFRGLPSDRGDGRPRIRDAAPWHAEALWLETPEHPFAYAVAQLRQDTKLGDYYNLVGFQTNLTYPEQKRVFSLIPGLEHAEFLRYGLMHRNAYLDAPRCLNADLSLQKAPQLTIAGQLAGVEGYVESAALGIIAGVNVYRKLEGKRFVAVPKESVLGALIDYLLHASAAYFEPMSANWALMPSSKKETRQETIVTSLRAIESYWSAVNE
jgi:methylenetetrahydrofolate--tRNA-(uracil-5-)-methyltransferase